MQQRKICDYADEFKESLETVEAVAATYTVEVSKGYKTWTGHSLTTVLFMVAGLILKQHGIRCLNYIILETDCSLLDFNWIM